MRTAIYGGSFDPPHIAHVLSAHYVLSVAKVDRVLVVPVYQHAFEKALTPFPLRVEMCKLAFRETPAIIVSEIEASLDAPNYTLHTILALQKECPEDRFRLVIGADVLEDTVHWHRFSEISRLAPPLVLGRVGFDNPGAPIAILPEVSSTEVRTWFQSPVSDDSLRKRNALIPAAVRDVIEREALYR